MADDPLSTHAVTPFIWVNVTHSAPPIWRKEKEHSKRHRSSWKMSTIYARVDHHLGSATDCCDCTSIWWVPNKNSIQSNALPLANFNEPALRLLTPPPYSECTTEAGVGAQVCDWLQRTWPLNICSVEFLMPKWHRFSCSFGTPLWCPLAYKDIAEVGCAGM